MLKTEDEMTEETLQSARRYFHTALTATKRIVQVASSSDSSSRPSGSLCTVDVREAPLLTTLASTDDSARSSVATPSSSETRRDREPSAAQRYPATPPAACTRRSTTHERTPPAASGSSASCPTAEAVRREPTVSASRTLGSQRSPLYVSPSAQEQPPPSSAIHPSSNETSSSPSTGTAATASTSQRGVVTAPSLNLGGGSRVVSSLYRMCTPIRLTRRNDLLPTDSETIMARSTKAAIVITFNLALSLHMLSSFKPDDDRCRRSSIELYEIAISLRRRAEMVRQRRRRPTAISTTRNRVERHHHQEHREEVANSESARPVTPSSGDSSSGSRGAATPAEEAAHYFELLFDIAILNNTVLLYLETNSQDSARRIFDMLEFKMNQADQLQEGTRRTKDMDGFVGNMTLLKSLFHSAPAAAA